MLYFSVLLIVMIKTMILIAKKNQRTRFYLKFISIFINDDDDDDD